MSTQSKIVNKIKQWLQIQEAPLFTAQIQELMTFEGNAYKNRIWYRGDAYELDQFFSDVSRINQSFWGARGTKGLEIRKIHTGLPMVIVNTLTNITIADLNAIIVMQGDSNQYQEIWDAIAVSSNAEKLFKKATKGTLIVGDGAFKVSVNPALGKYPLIEFISGERVEIIYRYGRVFELIFKTSYRDRERNYTLLETYGYGYVTYQLYNADGRQMPLYTIPQTAGLVDVVFDTSHIMAVPMQFFESEKYDGRGASIFEGKSDSFDSLDETVSQWIDALRAGRSKTYIPESLIPRDPDTGALIKPNAFDNRYISIGDDLKETGTNKVSVEQPTIPSENYLESYMTFLDLCMQGVISPSTLGIDVKKLDNAEAQREKEKATLYTRQSIVDALQEIIPKVVQCAINTYRIGNLQSPVTLDVEVSFGGYANPSFEAQIETLSNPNTPMSIEAKVDELWGDRKDETWKANEVSLIKAQQGLMAVPEPALGFGGPGVGV